MNTLFSKSVYKFSGLFLIVAILTSTVALAAAGNKIKIGVVGPMAYKVGQMEWWGAKIAADEINEAGGVMLNGVKHKIELVKADSNEMKSITTAVGAVERLIVRDKVSFITGGYTTEAVMAMQEVSANHQTIFMGGAGSPKMTMRVAKDYDKYKYYFRSIHLNAINFVTSGFSILEMAVDKVRNDLGIEKPRVAMVMDKLEVVEPFVKMGKKFIPKMGAEIAGVWRTGLFANDFTAELSAIKRSGAHLIYWFMSGPSGNVFSRQWGELEIPAIPMGFNTEAFFKSHWKKTNGMCDYAIAGHNQIARVEITPKTIPFYDKFLKITGEYPNYYTGTYDTIYILKEAVERAGSLDADALVLALEKTDYIGVTGRTAFNPRGHKFPHDKIFGAGYVTNVGVQWQGNKLVCVWPDGQHGLGNDGLKTIKYKGTTDLKLPPWMIKYWKSKSHK